MSTGAEGVTAPIDIVIVDKSPLVTEGLRAFFRADGRIGEIAVAAGVDEFFAISTKRAFDVAVTGWVLGADSGSRILEAVADRDDGPRVVVYTGAPAANIPHTVMALGGAAFCSKTEPPARLIEIVVEVARGQMVFPFLEVRRWRSDRLSTLTPREMAFVAALADGHSNKSLAAEFGVTVNTVKFHLRNAYAKLDARNRAQAVAVFLQSEGG